MWQEVPVPVIAAVHGHALGGGLQIALGADIRIVHPDTQLSVREVHWGLVPDMTGTFVLSRLVRPDVARELTYTARIISGTEALQLGLATRLSDDPHADAHDARRRDRGTEPRRGARVEGALQPDVRRGCRRPVRRRAERDRRPDRHANQIEAVMANMEKRAANFAD